MLKLLLKKQIMEFFRSFFYDYKKNKIKSKGQITGSIVLFVVLMLFVAGTFASIEVMLCGALSEANVVWMFFLLTSALGLVMGVFGSVFNTYSGLYLSKDNDLLISMPIPVGYIVGSRIFSVYLMGLMYSSLITVPAVILNFIFNGVNFFNALGGIAFIFVISAITFILSCILGLGVAKLSLKLKNKSYATVIIMIVGIGIYYYGYSKLNFFLSQVIENALVYGEAIKGKAYIAYLFGSVGEGNIFAIALFVLSAVALAALTVLVLSKTFLKIATATAAQSKVKYVAKKYKTHSIFGAFLQKEFARFTSSASYMVNCSIGILFIPVAGVIILIKSSVVYDALFSVFGNGGAITVLACGMLCLMACGNDMAAPSVSLEGKNIWIPQSMPVDSKTVLTAKMSVQLILSCTSSFVGSVLFSIALAKTVLDVILIFAVPLVFNLFMTCFDMMFGIKMPMMNWTNEIYPIKQSGGIAVALFGGWAIAIVLFGGYFLLMNFVSAEIYLLTSFVLLALTSFAIYKWIMNKGTKIFDSLK